NKPMVLELVTYRYRGHSIADANAEKYRTKQEIQDYQQNKDPINVFQRLLIEDKILTEDEAKDIDREARKEANDAADYADQSPFPEESDITSDVYWTVDNPGKHDN